MRKLCGGDTNIPRWTVAMVVHLREDAKHHSAVRFKNVHCMACEVNPDKAALTKYLADHISPQSISKVSPYTEEQAPIPRSL